MSISSATIDGNTAVISAPTVITGSEVMNWAAGQQVPISKGNTVEFTSQSPERLAPAQFSDSAQYTMKLMTAKGNTITNTATYAGP